VTANSSNGLEVYFILRTARVEWEKKGSSTTTGIEEGERVFRWPVRIVVRDAAFLEP
jgi:hypothetical protein